jgi:dipeptidyl aminopeptidase/acylaminoacyl peptidase
MGSARLLDWFSDDGERLHGVLLLPANYDSAKKYPVLVWVYGGVRLSDNLDRFGVAGPGPFNMQLFATRGFAVFVPDSPQHSGSRMLDLVKTVLPGISKLVETGIADPERIGLMGHSNGGYSVMGLLVQTTRFKAAVEISGMADLMALYGEMDETGNAFASSMLEHGLLGFGGTPWQLRNTYIENSPIYYLDRVTTPLLLLQGSLDESVKPFAGDEAYVAMRRLGKEAEYVKYQNEPHSPLYWTFLDQQDLCGRVIAWFEEHLEGPAS